ncbi:MAG: PGF-CTERM-anchored ABC transporter substrate-binding protein [Euryarchaeota archaeon]|nr:PGF-CTERM-anchored ABC transporter substrate-binding protein [Euryarchaeota archaeon]
MNLTDTTGTEITLSERPDRITTTNPSAAQTLWELDAKDRVVGVTQFASYLNGSDSKANVSASELGVSTERVVDTEPDLVLAPNASAGDVEGLRNAGLTVYHFPAATDVDDVAAKTETIGRLVGECAAAESVNQEMYDAVDKTRERTADLDRPEALYPLGGGFVAADETFINEIMRIGGVNNVAAAEGDGYPQLSDEVIISSDPEVLLVTDPDAPIVDQQPYASTTAGQENNSIVLDTNDLNQPAPRSVIEATRTLADGVEAYHDSQTAGEQCGYPVTLTDATGTEVTLDERPDRITTTNPSAAQTLWELDAKDRVVGVTQFASYLNGSDSKANVSASEFGVSTERVVDTAPDLVLAPNASAGDVEGLRNAGLTVYHFPAATDVDDVATKTETMGRLVGECTTADTVNQEMYDAVNETRERTADLDRPEALYPLGGGFVAADETFINEIMRIGGVNNVAAAEGDGYPQLSDEVIISSDPEVLLVTDPDAPTVDQQPYASTTAGRENNSIVLDTNDLNQPAPRSVIEATRTLADGVVAYRQAQDDEEPSESDENGDNGAGPDESTADEAETADDGMIRRTTIDIEDSDPEADGLTVTLNEDTGADSGSSDADSTGETPGSVDSVTFADDSISGTVDVETYTETPADIAAEISETAEPGDDGSESADDESSTDSADTAEQTVNVVSVSDISVTDEDGDPADNTPATVTMSVDAESVTAPTNTVIVHKTDDGWETLATTVTASNDERITLTAETGGFSLFAVAEVTSPQEDRSENQTVQENGSASETTVDESPGFGVFGTLVALCSMGVLARRNR